MKSFTPRIGIIGGLSYISSCFYYEQINKKYNEKAGYFNTPEIIMISFCFNEVIDALKNNEQIIISKMNMAFESLQKQEVDFIIIPCNTVHKYLDQIKTINKTELVHILEPVGVNLSTLNINEVGLLGTCYTMEGSFHHDYLKNNYNINTYVPSRPIRDKLNNAIFEYLCKGITHINLIRIVINALAEFKKQNIFNVILGCSELYLILNDEAISAFIEKEGITLWDTSTMHVDYVCDYSIKHLKTRK